MRMTAALDPAILRAEAAGDVSRAVDVDDPALKAAGDVDANPAPYVDMPAADSRAPVVTVIRDGVPVIAATEDALAELLASDAAMDFRTGEHTVLRARCDDVVRRIIHAGGDVTYVGLARELGTSPATLKKLMATALYRETYNRVSDEVLGTIDEAIADERRDIVTRGDSLQRRAQTLLGEAMEIARTHMQDAKLKATPVRPSIIQVGIDAAAEVRMVNSARGAMASAAGAGAGVSVTVTRQQSVVIKGVLAESGVDLSDVIGEFVSSTQGIAAANAARDVEAA
jgi:hypothetical protein